MFEQELWGLKRRQEKNTVFTDSTSVNRFPRGLKSVVKAPFPTSAISDGISGWIRDIESKLRFWAKVTAFMIKTKRELVIFTQTQRSWPSWARA